LALTLALWFAWEWLLFALRVGTARSRLTVVREVRDEQGPVDTLWAGRLFQVRIELKLTGGIGIPYATVAEWVPFGAEAVKGETSYEGPIEPGQAVELVYTLRCAASGRVRFEGLKLRLADVQGFFEYLAFIAAAATYRVLPSLASPAGQAGTVKRHNLLPPPGQHRFRRPGSGSELLDLRDYLPGDPPKTIAWKLSARRDRLITKEYESEVPVRCTLFVDASNSVRLGPPGQNALTGLVQIAAAVTQAVAGGRDFIGLCLFDEHAARVVRPARGPRHVVHLLNLLADSAGLAPTTGEVEADSLTPLTYAFAREVYPHLLRPEVNGVPFWLPWLFPSPPYTHRHPTSADSLYRWLPLLMPVYWVLGFLLIAVCWVGAGWLLNRDYYPLPVALVLIILLGFGLALAYIRIPPALFFPQRRRLWRWRKQLAAILSVRYNLGPGGLGRLLEDDEGYSVYLQRFLAEHHVPFPLPLYDRGGRFLFAAPAKVGVLSQTLTRAVGKGRDNELFVLLADLLELPDSLDPLLRAIRVALARHHRMLVVCPWPPGVPPPGEAPAAGNGSVEAVLHRATTTRFQHAYAHLRLTFGRLGVPVICAQSQDSPRVILERLALLREPGRKR
jgi:uncharacterized protein (DUF58 family)